MNTAPAGRASAPGRGADAAPRRARLAALLVGLAAFAVYLSPLRDVRSNDTVPARLLPFSILREGNVDLDEFGWLRVPIAAPYFLRPADGHWRSKYPLATPLIVTPLAAPFAWWASAHGIADDDARFRLLTVVMERIAAAAIGALTVALILLAAGEIAPLRWAVGAAVVAAFGTSLWLHSLALWQHGMTALAIAGAALALLRPPTRRRALAVGLLCGLAVAARPTASVIVLIIALFAWRERRAQFWWLMAPILAGAIAVGALNTVLLGRPTGGYGLGLDPPRLEAVTGLLVSPSRGLFVYTPLALLALAALRPGTRPVALRYFALALPAYALVFAGSRSWWAGWSYGPRFFTDIVPLLSVCALQGAQGMWTHRAGRALLLAAALWGVLAQAVGVYCDHDDWNGWPADVDVRPRRAWSWSDSQIPRSLAQGWHGGDLAPLLAQLATDPRPAPLVPLAPAQLASTIEALTPTPWHCGSRAPCTVELRVTNRSPDGMWPAYTDYGSYAVGVGAYWKPGDEPRRARRMWAPLPRHLGPGDSARIRLRIDPPRRPGMYELSVAVMQNRVTEAPIGDEAVRFPVVVDGRGGAAPTP